MLFPSRRTISYRPTNLGTFIPDLLAPAAGPRRAPPQTAPRMPKRRSRMAYGGCKEPSSPHLEHQLHHFRHADLGAIRDWLLDAPLHPPTLDPGAVAALVHAG